MGVTAEQFKKLSGPQALELFVSSLEKAGASQKEFTFYLESIANDATLLLPLLKNNAEGFRSLGEEAAAAGGIMSDKTISAASQLSAGMWLMKQASGGATAQIAEGMLPALVNVSAALVSVTKKSEMFAITGEAVGAVIKGAASLAIGATAIMYGLGSSIGAVAAAASFAVVGDFANAKNVLLEAQKSKIDAEKATKDAISKLWSGDSGSQERIKAIAALMDESKRSAKGMGVETEKAAKSVGSKAKAESTAAASAIKAIDDQVRALQFQAETVGMTSNAIKLKELADKGATAEQLKSAGAALQTVKAFEELTKETEMGNEAWEKAAESAKSTYASQLALIASLRTEEEKLTDQTKEQFKALEAISFLSEEDKAAAADKIAASGFMDAPKFGSDGGGTEFSKIDTAESELNDWYEIQLEMLAEYRESKAELNASWDAQELAMKQQHEDALAKIQAARETLQLTAGESFFGNMSGLAKTFFGEQSAMYKTMFAVEKAFAIAKVLLNAPSSYSKAYDSMIGIPYVGGALAVAAGVAAVAAQMAQAANIKGINYTGQAHDGIMSVPESGTWNLKKGERVTTENTSAKLDRTLDNVQRSQQSGGGGTVINLIEDKSKAGQSEKRTDNGQETIDIWISNLMGDGRVQKAMTRKFGLQPVGA